MLNPQPGSRVEVWGDPIAHSRSPQLHEAAYRVLGLEWTYRRRQVAESGFDGELDGARDGVRGLSLTMPLKAVAFTAARTHDRRAGLTGAVNTLLLTPDGPHGFNTDVGGLVRDLASHGVAQTDRARIVGAGATATSALVALGELGVRHVEVVTRRPGAVDAISRLGDALGIHVDAAELGAGAFGSVPVTVATLPGGAAIGAGAAAALAASGGLLYDVVYGHWPTELATAWRAAGAPAMNGLGMLVHQALLQVRVFVNGDVDAALADEGAVLAAMRDAVVGH